MANRIRVKCKCGGWKTDGSKQCIECVMKDRKGVIKTPKTDMLNEVMEEMVDKAIEEKKTDKEKEAKFYRDKGVYERAKPKPNNWKDALILGISPENYEKVKNGKDI